MSEEENVSVEQEVTQPAETEQTEASQESAAEVAKRNVNEHNWAEARRKMQEQERQNKDLQEQLREIQHKLQPPPKEEVDELDNLSNDDIITVAQAKKLATKMAKSVAQEVFKQREAATVDERLKLKFSDFDQVVTKENIELLKQTEPELVMSLYHNPDPYNQGVAAYKLLKKLGSQEESMPSEKKKAMQNSQKPVSVNAVSKTSAIGNASQFENGLTKELKDQLWKEMQEIKKRA